MGVLSNKILVAAPAIVIALVILPASATALRCIRGKQYLDHERQECASCTECDGSIGLLVLRPCEVHQNTKCGTLQQLLSSMHTENRHRHEKHHSGHHRGSSRERRPWEDQVTSTEVPFSSVEDLVWDWQAIALTFAVFSCILFFLVIALYSLHQARQWRRLKDNFEADVEELSARLSLMAASSSEKGEILEPSMGPIHDSNYLNNKCMYLEQLLQVRKEKRPGAESGNVYIEEGNASPSTPLTAASSKT